MGTLAHGSATFEGWRVPEHEIYEAMHVLRRKLVVRYPLPALR